MAEPVAVSSDQSSSASNDDDDTPDDDPTNDNYAMAGEGMHYYVYINTLCHATCMYVRKQMLNQ